MSDVKYRIAVTGREGQVCQATTRLLRGHGHEVMVLARPDADLLDAASIDRAIRGARPDLVVNAAAYTAVDRAEDEPAVAHAVNALGAEAVAAAAAAVGAPLIHFSTDYVFDGSKSTPYLETDPTGPLGIYGATKLEGERRVAAANPRHVILRTAWVCSPYGNNFVKTMLRLAANRPELTVVDDQHGSPTFAADLADAVAQLAPRLVCGNASPETWGVFHATNTGETTWCGFARAIMQCAQMRGGPSVPVRGIKTKDYPTKARRPAYSLLSARKLETVHGIVMRPWQSSLDLCLDELIGARRNIEVS